MPSQPSRARNRDPNKKKAGKSALAKKLKNDEKDLKQNERRLTKKHDALRTKWVDQELSQLQQHTTEKKAEKKKVEEEEEVEDDIEKELREEEEAEEVEEQEEGEGEEVEEEEEEEEEEVDLKDLPVIPLSTSNKSRLREIKERKHTKRDDNQKSAVVYLGRLPYGFFEWQMKEFMEQFGEVQRLYISKNKKTGRSRGYGFIEFLFPEVAEIVADTMHDYLMFKKRLVCKVLPQIKAKNLPWPTNQITVPNPFAAQRKYADKYNNEKKPVTLTSLVDKERRKRKRLAANNIDYKFDGYESLINTLRGEQKEEQAKIAEKKEKQVQKETDKKWEARQQEKTARDKAIRTEKKAKDQKEKKMEEKRQKEEKDRAFQAKIQDLPKTKAKKLLKTKEKKEKKAAEKEKEKQQAQKAEKAAEKDAEKKKRQAAAAKKKEQAAKRKAEKEAKQADESTNPPPAKKSRQQA